MPPYEGKVPPLGYRPPVGWADGVCAGLILVAVLAFSLPGISEGGFGWSDAPNHAMDGVFVRDFVQDWPLDAPRTWAESFYLRHPILGIVVYWPPGFAAVEAVVFSLLGVNVFAARLTVVLFAVGAGLMMYALGRRWFDQPTGCFAALLLVTCPHGVLWMNDVMLEWPATFWILTAFYAYQRDRDRPRGLWSILLAAGVVMAFLTKQTAGFILPVILLHAILADGRRVYWLRAKFIVSMLATMGMIVTYYLIARRFTALPSQLLEWSFGVSEFFNWAPEILGWPLLPVAVLGVLTLLATVDRRTRGLLALWFVAWTGFCLCIAAKEPRYLFFALPPMAFAAVRFLMPATEGHPEQRLSWRRDAPRLSLLTLLLGTQIVIAQMAATGRLPDHAGAVATLAERADADLVLVDAVRDGQFVFDAYRNDATREKIIPIRASKLLYARAARAKYGYEQFIAKKEDIVELLNTYGIRHIVLESALPKTHYTDADPQPRKLLRELMETDERFELVKRWPLRCEDPIWDDVELRLYAYPTCPKRLTDLITFSMPGMGGEVQLELPPRPEAPTP